MKKSNRWGLGNVGCLYKKHETGRMIFIKVILTILLSIVALAVLAATLLVLFEFYLIRQDNKFHEKYLSIAKGSSQQEIVSVLGDRPPIEDAFVEIVSKMG